MATTSEARALPFFTDLQGLPLSSGSIYIGQAGLDPIAYPAVITSDIAGTTVVAQPVRTTNGHAAAGGALIHLFVPIPYSITILDSAGRLVYASLQETDPVAVAIGASSVQSAANLAALRARSGTTSNQVWVTGFGMYIYQPSDTTSPENVPFTIVGNDGSRYALDMQFLNAAWAKISGVSANPTSQGAWYSWNDEGQGIANVTNNVGTGIGGFVFRSVNSGNTAELGRMTINGNGSVISTGDIRSAGNLIAGSGIAALNVAGTRALDYDSTADQYNLVGTGLNINNSPAVTNVLLPGQLVSIFQNHLVGAILLNTSSTVSPTPGTWFLMVGGLGSTGIAQWLRIA